MGTAQSHDDMLKENEKIGGYSERELLILLNYNVEQLKIQVSQQTDKVLEMQLMVSTSETRMKVWTVFIGFISGLAGALFVKFLS